MGKYFKTDEFTRSDTAARRGINNSLPKELSPNLEALIANVLDPLREAYGKPIRVNSGYRCPALNKAVGGVATSDHVKGCAADVEGTPATKEENRKLFALARSLNLPFDQLINENDFAWVHISHRKSGNRKQVLKL